MGLQHPPTLALQFGQISTPYKKANQWSFKIMCTVNNLMLLFCFCVLESPGKASMLLPLTDLCSGRVEESMSCPGRPWSKSPVWCLWLWPQVEWLWTRQSPQRWGFPPFDQTPLGLWQSPCVCLLLPLTGCWVVGTASISLGQLQSKYDYTNIQARFSCVANNSWVNHNFNSYTVLVEIRWETF